MMTRWFTDVRAFRRDPLELLSEKARNSDVPLVKLALGPTPVYLVNDPSLVKPLMKLSEDILDKGRLVKKISNVVGESSLTLSGEEHRKRRAILHERLSRGVANTYVGEMAAAIRVVAAEMARENTFRADILGGTLALKLASVALFGSRVLSPGDELAIMNAFHILEGGLQEDMFRFVPRSPWRYVSDSRKRRDALKTMDIVIRKVTQAASESSVLVALRDAGLSDEEIRNELTTMIIAGFHTTGAAVAWLCFYLATRPQELEQIRKEHISICDEFGELDPKRLCEAKVSLAFVKEVLRLYPSAWWLTRELKQDHLIGGETLAKGDSLIIAPWVYHRSSKHFTSPDEFSLDREHAGNAYLPFGAGARACVGMGVSLLELHLVALEFASTFDFSALSDPRLVKPKAGITLNAPEMSLGVSLRGVASDGLREAA
jgi:cytochrome P450